MTKRKKAEAAEATPAEVPAEVPHVMDEGESEPAATPPLAEDLERRLEEAEHRNRDLHSRLQYAQADLENARKRAERDIVAAVRFGNERLLASLLPVLDEFDAAVASGEAAAATGIGMVRDHLLKVLGEAGLEAVPTDGPFDPYLHEAVGRVNDAALPEGSIAEVVQKGYRFNFKLLRPAKVIVVRKEGGT